MEIKITKRTKLLEINNDMCHNFYYLVNGRFYNENKTAYRRFKFVIWFDIFDVDEYFNYIEYSKTLNDDNIKYYLVLNLDLDIDTVKEVLDGKELGNDGFLNKRTVYRMSEYTDRGVK